MFQYFQLLQSKLTISPISISGPMYLSTSRFSICFHILPIYFRVFSRLPVYLRPRPHGFVNLSIFYLPPHFSHLLPCIFKNSRLPPTSAPWICQPPNFLFVSTFFLFTLPCIFKNSSLSPTSCSSRLLYLDPTRLHVMTLLSSTWILRLRISSLR